ncbi:MAG: dTDP-glucose 4,6-dehydratase, partial [Candidatus Paceibacteria bacterium]
LCDLKALDETFEIFKPDYVINFAAESHVDRSIHGKTIEFIHANVIGVFNLLEIIKAHPVEKYVQVSTDEVYGSTPLHSQEKFSPNHPLRPSVPYSATKAAGDLLCNAYYATWKLPVVVTHCTNNYGPYQYPEKMIPFFILRMLEGKTLPLHGDGQHIRDWLYVLDHAEALELCLFKGKPGEIYNIGAGNERRNIEIARMILSYFDRDDSWLEFVPDRPGNDRRYALDTTKIRTELGWEPKANFAKAFDATVRWYLENQDWIENVRKKSEAFNHSLTIKKEDILQNS